MNNNFKEKKEWKIFPPSNFSEIKNGDTFLDFTNLINISKK